MRPGEELVFRNGTVFDGTRFLPAGTSVRVHGGTITAVGPVGPDQGAALVDLDGGTLLPGFIDAHVHPVFAGDQLRRCDLTAASTASGYVALVAAYAKAHPEEEWITGGGWSMDAFPGGIPTRDLLDAVVADRPVYLPNRDGHGVWVNSKALALAGIGRSTPDPADGRIERDAAGEPVGMLQEGAADLVERLLPPVTEEDWYQALLTAQAHLLSLGITGWQDAIVGGSQSTQDPLGAYLRAAEAGTLAATVVGALWWDRDRGLEQLPELLESRRTGQAGRFRATSVKMMLDGVAENHTAAMLEPYLDADGCRTEHSGMDFIDPRELPRFPPTIASCQPVMPSDNRCACASSNAWYQSSPLTGGRSRDTSEAAPSCSMPFGWPAASRSIRPSAGSGVVRSIPASVRAMLLTQAPWPSRLGRNTGRSATTASSSSRVGIPPGKASIDQPPPVIHSSSG